MAVFSSLRNSFRILNSNVANLFTSNTSKINGVNMRMMSGHHKFPLEASRFQYRKFKDMLHLYIMIGLIPIGLLVTYVNIFIGPATLTETPEGYTPKHWEYYKHPITRFIARYVSTNPQQDYEKYLHFIDERDEIAKIRLLEKKVKNLMKERADYQAYYYVPYTNANFSRIARERGEAFAERFGDP